MSRPPTARTELLAPAGDIDCAFAALQHGADAIYAGMRKFSARAEAVNLSAEELGEVIAYAHSLSPARRVYVTVNTVVLDRELPELVDSLALVSELGADAVIVQDLGVARIVRAHYPGLRLHASTQLAIHNLEGAAVARELGFERATLARELPIDEVREIAAGCGIEVETFVHGALCYCYSGLCLYSSLLRGRSGNRGRCAYPCRDRFRPDRGGRARGDAGIFPFSMKDMALPDDVPRLRDAGVTSFKIEGRKKSALYVAAVTTLYRGLLDGSLAPQDRRQIEADIQTIFARPWTRLYAGGRGAGGVCDTEIVGHRGTAIGRVEGVLRRGRQGVVLRLRTSRELELHDGLQIDLPDEERPYGFAVDSLSVVSGGCAGPRVFEAAAGATVEVALPAGHPAIPVGVPVYCSSSQSVKRRYRFERPRPGVFRVRRPIDVRVTLRAAGVAATATCGRSDACAEVPCALEPGRNVAAVEPAVRQAFEKLGDTAFSLRMLAVENPDGLFAPVSVLNRLRRELVGALEAACAVAGEQRVASVKAAVTGAVTPSAQSVGSGGGGMWSLKVDDLRALDMFDASDWCDGSDLSELCVEIDPGAPDRFVAALDALARRVGRERIRLALPLIVRGNERKTVSLVVKQLMDAGWTRWEAANLSSWDFARGAGDLTTDWSVYVLNRAAAEQAFAMGATRITLSPEDDAENAGTLLGLYGARALAIVYQQPPLFVSETCAFAEMAGGCERAKGCQPGRAISLVSGSGEHVLLCRRGCRSVVVPERAFCRVRQVPDLMRAGARWLRVDLTYAPHSPEWACTVWRAVRAGRMPEGSVEWRTNRLA